MTTEFPKLFGLEHFVEFCNTCSDEIIKFLRNYGDPDARVAVAICHNGMSNNPSKTFQPIRAAVEQVFGV